MSQFDMGNLESPLSGTVFINGNLEPWRDALHSGHSGDTRPSYAVAGMTWIDTTTNPWLEKLFDGSEDIIKGYIDTVANTYTPAGVSQAAEDISFDNTDSGLTATNVQDAIDEAVSDFSDFEGRADGFATAAQGALADTALQNLNTSGSSVPTTSGASVTVASGISGSATRVVIGFNGVSTNGTSNILLQIGDSGGLKITGYQSSGALMDGSGGVASAYTTGFGFRGATATNVISGTATLDLIDPSTNTWAITALLSGASGFVLATGGSVSLISTLTQIRLTTVNGTDAFDAGSVVTTIWSN